MSRNLYIATMEPRSGKSVIALGLMEILSRRIQTVGFFRPIIQSGHERDNDIELILSRYDLKLPYEDMYAYTYEAGQSMVAEGRSETLLKNIVSTYKNLEKRCDFVLCEGTDFTGVSSAFEFDFNAKVANNLGSPILALVNGGHKSPEEILEAVRMARESFEDQGCSILARIVNRVDSKRAKFITKTLRKVPSGSGPVYVLSEEGNLGKPTVGEIARALDGKYLHGDPEWLNREVQHLTVAAMHLLHFLKYVREGALIITPGDRADVILGSLATSIQPVQPGVRITPRHTMSFASTKASLRTWPGTR